MSIKIAIIIPILNEANNLPRLQTQLKQVMLVPNISVHPILVDGGSDDDSLKIAKSLSFDVITAKRGRARQQNTGARFAIEVYQPDILLFLHADTQLPDTALQLISDHYLSVHHSHHFWGRFNVRLDSPNWLLKLVSIMINLRSWLTGVATGDQALFIHTDMFQQLNGFADMPLMEDVELCKRLRQIAKPVCLKEKVITSARRWEKHGQVKTIVLMWRLRFEYWLGVSPEKLAMAYGYQPN